MVWRDATEEEASSIQGQGWRDATPQEAASIKAPVKKKSAADIVIEKPQARERLTMGGEFTGGLKDFFGDMFGGNVAPEAGVVESTLHRLRAPLGLARTYSAGMAPVTNAVTGIAESVSDVAQKLPGANLRIPGVSDLYGQNITLADILGAGTSAVGDVVSGAAIAKGLGSIKPALARLLPTKADKIARLERGTAIDIGKATQQGEKDVVSSRALQDAQLKEVRQQTAASEAEIGRITKTVGEEKAVLASGQEAAEESYTSIAKAAREQVPDVKKIKATLAKDAPLGKAAGETFKESYNRGLSVTKTRFNEQYDTLLKTTDNIEVNPEHYSAQINKILGEKGVSRPLPTSAEATARKAKSMIDVDEDVADQVAALEKQIKSAADPNSKVYAESALKEFIRDSDIADQPTVAALIRERQRIRAAERSAFQAKNDNLYRQFKELREGIEADIPKDVFASLKDVDQAYFKEYVPYFSKHSVTRSIAEGSPDSVVDAIVRPSTDKKAVEKVTRAFELMDSGDKESVAKAFMNKTIDRAFKEGEFSPKRFSDAWDKYADVAGNKNEMLRTALGARYQDAEGIVNTLRTAKAKSLDETARQAIKSMGEFTQGKAAAIEKAAGEKITTLKGFIEEAPKLTNKSIQDTGKEIAGFRSSTEAQVQALKTKLVKDIEEITGKPVVNVGSGFVGSLFIVEGAITLATGNIAGGLFKVAAGGLIILSRAATAKLMNTKRGLSVFRSLTRSAPGSVQAMASARIAANILKSTKDDNE